MRIRTAPFSDKISAAKPVAPDDLVVGDWVSILRVACEVPSFYWADSVGSFAREVVRLEFLPNESGIPLRVRAICLPFVAVQAANGEITSLDVRRCQIARLDRQFARFMWKSLRKA